MRYAEILEACWKGYRQAGMKKKGDRQVPNCVPVSENEVRNDADNFSPNDNALDRLHHEFIPTWQILNHRVLKTAYNFADDDTALEFVQAIKQMGERMDHNGVITLDNAQVTVEVTTHDVNGLTRLDFEYALKAHDLSNKMNGDQEPHPTNSLEAIEEDLKKWFKEKWVRFGPDGKIRGDCARGSSKEGKPKCLPQSKAHALGKKGRASAAAKKRREDPNAERRGAAKNVATRVNEFAPSPGFGSNGEPDRYPRIPQKFHKGDVVWVAAPKSKSRSHFPGNAPAVVLGSYDDQYGDDMVYVDVDLDDPDLTPDDRQYYTDEAKRKAAQEHQYDIFLLHNREVGETAWYPESDLTAVPAGTNVEALFTKGNAAPWTKVPAKIKKIISNKLGQQGVAEEQLGEKQDACYRKVKSRYKVWPSAYASGALVQCRKKGAANWGNKKK